MPPHVALTTADLVVVAALTTVYSALMLQHAEDFGLGLIVRHAVHSDKLDTPRVTPLRLLEVLTLRLIHYEHDTIINCSELLVRESRRVHLKLGLADVCFMLRVVMAAHA